MRTTLDIEKPVLEELKRLQKSEKKTLGELASTLLAEALEAKRTRTDASNRPKLIWTKSRMRAKVDLGDKDAVYRALDA